MLLKLNPSLRNVEETKELCKNILRNASFTLRGIMLEKLI